MIHELKTWSEYFHKLKTEEKTFEVRKNDRNFKVGDLLLLREYNPNTGYTNEVCWRKITYILDDPNFVKDGFVILGIKNAEVFF
ncbi:DUF3850 domain-containing protein [Paenibacillus naphthalenovorans]|uniref:PUA-like domain-containing protein n=1 Tax=Paenibacillus naphthalenovorans TaxID=162209 RepID=A0A0U2MWD2_9BACL|nr:DUF3850 domain-containing protein [Paenibacillus naphthalenovorans]ALS22175.1 PUA-like domain-containing protein [Paenibacillus naphthalenovorans]